MNGVTVQEQDRRGDSFERISDYAAYRDWVLEDSGSGTSQVIHLLRCAIQSELTEKQLSYLTRYFADGMTVSEIGEMYGVNQSTVSRTINRAKNTIKRVMKYADKRLLALLPQCGQQRRKNNIKRRTPKASPGDCRVAGGGAGSVRAVPGGKPGTGSNARPGAAAVGGEGRPAAK